jgi:cytochrome P450
MQQTSLPPGPSDHPLAQMFSYVRGPYEFFERHQREHGDVFTVNLPGIGKQVVVASPEVLKELTQGSYESYERWGDVLRYILGDHAVIFQEGAPHRRLRKLMTPPFQGDRMRGYGPVMMRVTDQVLGKYGDGEVVELRKPMQEITIRVILHCVFGLDEGPRFERLRTMLIEFVEAMLTPWAFVSGLVFKGRRVLKLLEFLGEKQRNASPEVTPKLSRIPVLCQADRLGAIDAVLFDEIERAKREAHTREDILAMLVGVRDEEGKPLSREELRDQLITLMLGGHETTSNSLCWALYLLAKSPEAVSAIRAEQAAQFPQGFDPLRASQLSYLGGAIQESMRLMPIAVGVSRKLKVDMVMDGYHVPAGTLVMPASYLAQRHPRLWENPLAFDPTRFVGKKPAPSAHFPFGSGVWRCLGAAFADYEMRVVLTRFLERFDVELLPGQVAKPFLQGFTITPADGMPLRLRLRAAKRASEGVAAQETP